MNDLKIGDCVKVIDSRFKKFWIYAYGTIIYKNMDEFKGPIGTWGVEMSQKVLFNAGGAGPSGAYHFHSSSLEKTTIEEFKLEQLLK